MILVLYNIILITNFKLIEMCIKSSPDTGGELFTILLLQYVQRKREINALP